jgi:hypothetical protein
MHFTMNLPLLLAVYASSASAANIPRAVSINGTILAAQVGSFSMAEFDDRGCSQSQNDWTLKDGKCYSPGSTTKSLKLFYRSPGCKRMFFSVIHTSLCRGEERGRG